jgi:predicted RNase H-related nuclease YkuK (DUF458 family)
MMKGERKPGATAVFRDHRGEAVADPKQYVQAWLKAHPGGRVYVGCDSKVRGSRVKYSTAICLWNIGKGVKEIYKNEVEKRPPDRYTRLWSEVTRAVEVADLLKGLTEITVHVDINSNPQYRSHQLYDASIGLITSMGFQGAGKPFSWAASCGAHKHCQ